MSQKTTRFICDCGSTTMATCTCYFQELELNFNYLMEHDTDTMRNAATAIFNACALPFPSREMRRGLEYCMECSSSKCEHCICVICGHDECEHFFILPLMNPALDVAWRNADWPYRRLDGRCFCKTCNTKFACPDWDINPHISCCDGDCDTCPACIAREIVAGRRRCI